MEGFEALELAVGVDLGVRADAGGAGGDDPAGGVNGLVVGAALTVAPVGAVVHDELVQAGSGGVRPKRLAQPVRVEVGVDIAEARHDDVTGCIDDVRAGGGGRLGGGSDGCDGAVIEGDVDGVCVRGAVEQAGAGEDGRHDLSLCPLAHGWRCAAGGAHRTDWPKACRRIQACMAIAAAAAAFIDRVEPYCSIDSTASQAVWAASVRPGPSWPKRNTHFSGSS